MINMIIEVFATVCDVLFMIWLIPKFNQTPVKKRPISLIFPAVFLIGQLVADKLTADGVMMPIENFTVVIVFALTLGFSLCLKADKIIWSIFAACIFPVVIMLSASLTYGIFSLLVDDLSEIMQGADSAFRIVFLVTAKIMEFLFFQIILILFRKEHTLDIKNGILSILFTAITAVSLGVLMEISVLSYQKEVKIAVIVSALSLIVLNVILYVMIYQLQRLMKNKHELTLMQDRMNFEEKRMNEANIAWDNMRKIRHDMKNHLTVINGKLEEGDTAFCKEYIADLTDSIENMGEIIRSGNAVVDYLVNSKLSSLQDTEVAVSGHVDKYEDIDNVDLACILGNILDNAVEAERKVKTGKRIELLFFKKNASRVIICKNTVAKSVLNENQKLKSTKESPDLHGLGHQIVESKVEKYGGLIDYFEENDMFGVQVVLPEKALAM